MTCPRLDLAQGCSSARLARKSGLPREPQGKGPAPRPPTFLPRPRSPAPRRERSTRRRALSGGSQPRLPRHARFCSPPCEHRSSHTLPLAEAGSQERAGMWAAMLPPDKGAVGGSSRAAALPGLPGSPGLLTGGFWENRSSLDFPKTSDKCPHPSSPQEPEQPPPTVGEGTGEEEVGNVGLQKPRIWVGLRSRVAAPGGRDRT